MQAFLGELVLRPSPQTPTKREQHSFPIVLLAWCVANQRTVVKKSVDRLNKTHNLVAV